MFDVTEFNAAKAAQERLNKLFYPQRVVKVWNKGEVIRISKKYTTRREFKAGDSGAYNFALAEDVTAAFTHFDNRYKWSKGNILAAVAKCEFFQELHENNPGAYTAAKEMGMLKDIKKKLPYRDSPLRLAWPDERIRKVSMKFKYLRHLANAYPQAYNQAKMDGELLEELRDFYKTKRREAKIVAIKEKAIQKTINIAEGYRKLTKWTDETLWAEAQKYESSSEFRAGCMSAYNILCKKGKLREFTAHYVDNRTRLTAEECTYEVVKAEAERCGSLRLFRLRNSKLCRVMYANNWREIFFPDTPLFRTWNKDQIREEMKKYTTVNQLHRRSGGAYMKGRRLGMQDEFTEYFSQFNKAEWDEESILEEAKKHRNISVMSSAKGGGAAVGQAKRLGIYHLLQEHFGYEIGTNGKKGRPRKRMRSNVIEITDRPPGL